MWVACRGHGREHPCTSHGTALRNADARLHGRMCACSICVRLRFLKDGHGMYHCHPPPPQRGPPRPPRWSIPTPAPAVPPVPSDRLDETAGASLHACVHTSGAGFQGGDSTRDGAVPSDGTLRLTELHAGATKNALSAEEQPLIYCVGAGVGVGVGVGMGVGMCVRCRLS